MIINYVKILDRLERIRKILVVSFAALLAVALLLYLKADWLIGILIKPLGSKQLVYLTPMEGIMSKIQIAFFGALTVCFPFILWQSARFAAPLLTGTQKKIIYAMIPLTVILFGIGLIFGFSVITPVTLKFLLETGQQYMVASLSANRYFSFVIMLSLGMGLVFELPLVMFVLAILGIIKAKTLREKRKIAAIAIVVLTAILTPTPDALTFVIASLPVLALYELSILAISAYEKMTKSKKLKSASVQEV